MVVLGHGIELQRDSGDRRSIAGARFEGPELKSASPELGQRKWPKGFGCSGELGRGREFCLNPGPPAHLPRARLERLLLADERLEQHHAVGFLDGVRKDRVLVGDLDPAEVHVEDDDSGPFLDKPVDQLRVDRARPVARKLGQLQVGARRTVDRDDDWVRRRLDCAAYREQPPKTNAFLKIGAQRHQSEGGPTRGRHNAGNRTLPPSAHPGPSPARD